MKEQINTDKAPAAIGPYSQAVRAGGFLFSSGQIPLDPATGKLVQGGVEAQFEQVVANLKAVLAAAGLGLDDVVKSTVFLQDMGDFAAVNALYAKHFSHPVKPARSAVQVAKLPMNAMVEVEVVAVLGD